MLFRSIESMVPAALNKERWKRVESVLVVPRGHQLAGMASVSLEQIASYPLIMPPRGGTYGNRIKLEELFHSSSIPYRIVMESSNVELSAVYVEMGLGISFATVVWDLPVFQRRNFSFVSLSNYFEPEYLSVITRKNKVSPPYMEAFLKLIFDHG